MKNNSRLEKFYLGFMLAMMYLPIIVVKLYIPLIAAESAPFGKAFH